MPTRSAAAFAGIFAVPAVFTRVGSNYCDLMRYLIAAIWLSGLGLTQNEPSFEARPSFVRPSSRQDQNAWVWLGPQEAMYIKWDLANHTRTVLQLSSPAESLAVRLETADGRPVPVTLAIEPVMRRRATPQSVPFDEPLGPVTLDDNETVGVYAVVERADHQPFSPGEYRVTFDASDLGGGLRRTPLILDPLETAAALLEYHRIEAAFYMWGYEPGKALAHRQSIVALPGAQVSDRMALGKAYAELGRHPEAVQVYEPILPELMESARRGGLIRDGRHFLEIARSYLAVGRQDTAGRLIQAEGIATPSQIPELLKTLSRRRETQRRTWYWKRLP